ncbi:MAG: hypothetical protein RL760_177 [Candidatus Eisenbacteria bacterium]|jgi:hypothetical protein
MRRHGFLSFLSCSVLLLARPVHAGVTNPDLSVIGQPSIRWTDDTGDPARKRPVFDVGETECILDAALNPYAHGTFTLAFADGEASVEEGYFELLRGLPGGLQLKGGKYRVGFGKLNPTHPHAQPFRDRFGVLAAYLPGAEGFNETGMDLSWRVPVPGSWAFTANADLLQGDSFRRERTTTTAPDDPLAGGNTDGDRPAEPRTAWLGRLSTFAPLGDRSGLELGGTATEGTNNVAAAARTRVLGVDAKLKWWTSENAYLLVQGEFLHLDRDEAGWDVVSGGYTRTPVKGSGGYLFADLNWAQRYDAGLSYERFQDPAAGGAHASAIGAFAGLALMEETTVFRLDWRRLQPARAAAALVDPAALQQLTLRVIFSMGPHKAHQF